MSDEDLHAYQRVLDRDPKAPLARRSLCDISGIDDVGITSSGVREAVRIELARNSQWVLRKQAIVAARDVVFGLGRMYELMAEALPWEIRVFRGAVEARRWLEQEERKEPGRSVAST